MGAAVRASRYRDWYASSGISQAVAGLPGSVRMSIVDARMVGGEQARPACSAVARRARAAVLALEAFDATPAHTTMEPADAALAGAGPDEKALSCAEAARRSLEDAQAALGALHAQLKASFEDMGGVCNDHVGEALASSAMLEMDLMSARTVLAGALGGR